MIALANATNGISARMFRDISADAGKSRCRLTGLVTGGLRGFGVDRCTLSSYD